MRSNDRGEAVNIVFAQLAISQSLQEPILFVGLALCLAWIVTAGGKYLLLKRLSRYIRANTPRVQPGIFVMRLRDLVFQNPSLFMGRLWADDRRAFVQGLWKEVRAPIGRAGLVAGLPDEGMDVYRLHMPDGRAIAVVRMPNSPLMSEPILLGIVLPTDPSLGRDLVTARKAVRFFVLSRYQLGRSSDLCEWTIENKQLTYNVGASSDPEEFASAVAAKLEELGR
jgi:hypothetical protein